MKLEEYIKKVAINELGRRSGVSPSIISRVARGQRRLSPDNAARISAATDGVVTIQELLFPHGLQAGARMSPEEP